MSRQQQPSSLTRGQFLRGATATVAAAVTAPSLGGFPATAGAASSSGAATSGPTTRCWLSWTPRSGRACRRTGFRASRWV